MINEQLVNLSNDFFQNSLDASPTSAIMRGHKAYFDKIEELTEEQFEIDSKNVDDYLKRLREIEFNSLSDREQVTYGMLEFALGSNRDSLLGSTGICC